MKNDSITGVLVGVLTLCTLLLIYFCVFHIVTIHQVRSIQAKMMAINARRQAINALATDVMEYSKTHPAIDPVLESVGLRPVRPTK